MEETHPSSDHMAVDNFEGSYTRGLPSTATSPEAPNVATFNNNQDSHTPYQNRTDPWDSAPNTASMFSSAQRFNISGQPHFVNIANINQLSNLGGSQGLENFQKSVSPNALHDSSAQELDRQVQQSLRKNTLKQLQDWTDNPIVTEHIIWINGSASIGKTAIALDIAWTRREKVAATFFFSRTDASRNDGNRLFPTLAWQFMISIPDIKKHIIHSINERPDMQNKGVEAQFEYLIAQPFAAMKETTSAMGLSGLVVVIDGIDECIDIRLQRRILKVIGNAIQDRRVPLRFIISSRPDAHIQETFHQFQWPVFCIDLAKSSPTEEIRKREEEIEKREEEIRKRETAVGKREEAVGEREEAVGKREEEIRKREGTKIPTGPSSFPGPPPTATAQWDVSPQQKALADKSFNGLDVHNRGYIESDVAVPFMQQSMLPEEDLARIWDLADFDHTGRLTRDGFALAVHFIRNRLSGLELPAPPPSFRNGSTANPTPCSCHNDNRPPPIVVCW
ncbi:hypothetical protein M378DRAFT_556648 [Amanita muscaria Koide BX008]|uniref:NACHT domain-containing protein n=1 Tax=Amanita muscaria (strain Koide BX008) TaxID=946122 RepID=A0A0C2X8F8_AMAMK|nr:hypothetical protein M378DRAFT_556648 [Amanita muscaria Koide BX008]